MKNLSIIFQKASLSRLASIYPSLILLFILSCLPLYFNSTYIDAYTQGKWTFLYATTAVGLILSFMGPKDFVIPQFSKLQQVLLICLLTISTQNLIQHGPFSQSLPMVDRVIFLIFVFYFIQALTSPSFLRSLSLIFILNAILIMTVAYLQAAELNPPIPNGGGGFSSLFGNTNFTSEFLAYTLVFSFFYYPTVSSSHKKILLEIAMGTFLAYILYWRCRSAYLGLLLCVPYILWRLRPMSGTAVLRVLSFTTFFFYFQRFLSQRFTSKIFESFSKNEFFSIFDSQKVKPLLAINTDLTDSLKAYYTINMRWSIWLDALELALRKPAGTGMGSFTFAHILDSVQRRSIIEEYILWEHPHNEVVKFVVEDGWLFFGLLVVLCLSFLIKAWRVKRPEAKSTPNHWQYFISLFAIFLFNSLTSFPLSLPLEFLIAALLLALLFHHAGEWKELKLNRGFFSLGSLTLSALVFSSFYRVDFAERVFKDKGSSLYQTDRACQLVPSHWQVCLAAARNHMSWRDWDGAEKVLKDILLVHPYHYPALRVSAELSSLRKNQWDECLSLWAYDRILSDRSDLKQRKEGSCSKELLENLSNSHLPVELGLLAGARRDSQNRR